MDSINRLRLINKLSCAAVNSRVELLTLETSMQKRARRLELVKNGIVEFRKENGGVYIYYKKRYISCLHNKDTFQRYITLSVFWNTLEAVNGRGY